MSAVSVLHTCAIVPRHWLQYHATHLSRPEINAGSIALALHLGHHLLMKPVRLLPLFLVAVIAFGQEVQVKHAPGTRQRVREPPLLAMFQRGMLLYVDQHLAPCPIQLNLFAA